ncbi:MAG: hypothetical protein ACYDEA_01695 [Candidatus Dormibacteria bacterium]
MSREESTLPVHPGQTVSLRALGYDEIWLQNWLAEKPERLGLGHVNIIGQEMADPKGGSLDLLAFDGEGTYYSVEVQFGEVDASHSFRVFDYWARNRDRYRQKSHVAVLIVETARGRYRQALEALAEYLPLIVIELRVWKGDHEAVLVPEVVIANEALVGGPATAGRTEKEWREKATLEAWTFYEELVAWTRANLGDVRVDFTPKSYIGVRRGRRVWAPLWLRMDGAMLYLPDPDRTRSPEPSPAFQALSVRLRDAGIEANWQTIYNAGANPIVVRLRRPDLGKPAVQELLRATFEALGTESETWSETHPVAAALDSLTDPDDPGGSGVPLGELPGPGTESVPSPDRPRPT